LKGGRWENNVGCLSTCQFKPSRLVGLVVRATGGAEKEAVMMGLTMLLRRGVILNF
jgi:hypothetical protein